MTSTASTLVHRRRRTTPAGLSALLLLAAAVLAGWAAVQTIITGSPPPFLVAVGGWLTKTPWASIWVVLIGLGLVLLGLWWVVLAWKPGPTNAVPVASPPNERVRDAATVLTRPALARLASATAQDIDGVDRVASTVGRRRVALRVDTTLHDAGALASRVGDAVTGRLESCGVTPTPAVAVRIRKRAS